MDVQIEDRFEQERGCGRRKPRGIYLVAEPQLIVPCGRLPVRLERCQQCGAGIKPARGWTWISPAVLAEAKQRDCITPMNCGRCMFGRWIQAYKPNAPAHLRSGREAGGS